MKLTFKPVELKDAKLIFENREFEVIAMTAGITRKEFNSRTLNDQKKLVRAWVADRKKGTKMTFVVLQEGAYIGRCQLQRIDKKNKSSTISLQTKKEYWGKGYGAEIIAFLEQLAFTKLRLNRLEYGCYSHNERSIRLAKKCGYIYEGTKRREKKIGSKFYDGLIFSKLKTEYKKSK